MPDCHIVTYDEATVRGDVAVSVERDVVADLEVPPAFDEHIRKDVEAGVFPAEHDA